jgi:PHD/YefM family antitoxin component YafN of YafNO toxin-antitoxin module
LLKGGVLRKANATARIYRIPITKARTNLGQLARRVRVNKEYFILEKDGIPVVGLMDPEELEDYLELRDPEVREHIRKSHQEFLAGRSRPMEEFLAERAAHKPGPPRRRSRT